MLEIQRPEEPDELRDFRNRVLGGCVDASSWEKFHEDSPGGYQAVVTTLLEAQAERCAYCERKLQTSPKLKAKDYRESRTREPRDHSSPNMYRHVDHVEAKSSHPKKTLDFDNMVLSCSDKDTCGHAKGDSELPLKAEPGVNIHFTLQDDGRLSPCDLGSSRKKEAQVTIDILNLNEPKLIELRRSRIRAIEAIAEQPDALQHYRDSCRKDELGETLYRYLGGQ